MITTCVGATRGGSTRPLSSPCTMIITPIVRVVRPQLFCHTNLRSTRHPRPQRPPPLSVS